MMWRDYFGNRCTIPRSRQSTRMPRLRSFFSESVPSGIRATTPFGATHASHCHAWVLVVDNRGRTYDQQRTTLEWLLPHMRPGGVYVCGRLVSSHSTGNEFAAFVHGMADELNSFTDAKGDPSVPDQRITSRATGIQTGIKSICLYPFVAVIELTGPAR